LRPEALNITRSGVVLAPQGADDLLLRSGAEVVVRVLTAPHGGGQGLISLAGRQIRAELPAGLVAGQRLRVSIEAEVERVLLRIVSQRPDGAEEGAPGHAAALALSGNGELVRAAMALIGPEGAVVLPGGGQAAVEVEVDPDDTSESDGKARSARATVTLHSPELGPLQISLLLTPGGISASVTAEPGVAAETAAQAADELRAALERGAARPAAVTVATRGPAERRPVPILPADWVDIRA
jgi:hypothetical protein